MKWIPLAAGVVAACQAFAVGAAEESTAPQQVTLPRQRVGDLVVHGSVAPAWLVPSTGAAAAAAARPSGASETPPVRGAAGSPVARMGSVQWRERIAALEIEIESRKADLVQARESLVTAVSDEAREAQEQYQAAQRRAEEMRRSAERAAALAAAARPQAATPAPTAQPLPAARPAEIVFALRKSDRTIAAALSRWAEEAKFHVLWEDKEDPKVPFEDTYSMPLPDAVFKVVSALNLGGMRLLMCEYSNRVVRVVPAEATCKVNRNIQTNLADGAGK